MLAKEDNDENEVDPVTDIVVVCSDGTIVFEDITDDDVETDEGIVEVNEFDDDIDVSVPWIVDVDSDELLANEDNDKEEVDPVPNIVVVVPDETIVFEDIIDDDVETDERIVEDNEFDDDIDVSVPWIVDVDSDE